jgi:hypothetical protein
MAPKGCGKTNTIHQAGRPRGVLVVHVKEADIEKLVVQGHASQRRPRRRRSAGLHQGGERVAKEHGGRLPIYAINVEGDRANSAPVGSPAKSSLLVKAILQVILRRRVHVLLDTCHHPASGMTHDPRAPSFVDIPADGGRSKARHKQTVPAQAATKKKWHAREGRGEADHSNPAWLGSTWPPTRSRNAIDTAWSDAEQQVESLCVRT